MEIYEIKKKVRHSLSIELTQGKEKQRVAIAGDAISHPSL